jgi:hypothetical protein
MNNNNFSNDSCSSYGHNSKINNNLNNRKRKFSELISNMPNKIVSQNATNTKTTKSRVRSLSLINTAQLSATNGGGKKILKESNNKSSAKNAYHNNNDTLTSPNPVIAAAASASSSTLNLNTKNRKKTRK